MRLFASFIFGVILLTSCTQEKRRVNSEGLKSFAESIEEDVRLGNKASLLSGFDINGFEDKCVARINGTRLKRPISKLRDEYVRQAQVGVELLFDDLTRSVREGGYFKLSKLYSEAGVNHLVFASYSWIGVNFFDFQIADHPNGYEIIDYYNFYSGEEYSETIVNNVMNELLFGSLAGEYSRVLSKMRDVEYYDSIGDLQRAWEKINEIPPRFDNKAVQKLRLDLSKRMSKETYEEALKDYIRKDSSDKRFRLYQQMNYCFLKGNYSKALNIIDTLESIVGKGLMFNLLKGDCYRGQKRYEEAIEEYDRVISDYPTLYHSYYYKFESLKGAGNDEDARNFAKIMKREFNLSEIEIDSLAKTN